MSRRSSSVLVYVAAALVILATAGCTAPRGSISRPKISYSATLTFKQPLTVNEFKAFVRETGVMPTLNTLQGKDDQGMTTTVTTPGVWAKDATGKELQGTPQPGSEGIDSDHLQMFIADHPLTGLAVVRSEVILDNVAYGKLKNDARVTVDTGSEDPPQESSEAIVKKWKDAASHINTLRGSQTLRTVDENGASLAEPNMVSYSYTTDEVYDKNARRYHIAIHFQTGDAITIYDGTTSYRYFSWLNEVYKPVPDGSAYWMDDSDDDALLSFLPPADVGYNLVGRRELDGRQVIELVVKGGNVIPNGMDGTHVYLDDATYLPYRVTVFSPAPAGKKAGLERTFTTLQFNGAIGDADFQLDVPANSVTVYEQAYMAPRIATFTSLQEAAKQAGFSLFAPDNMEQSEVFTMYLVEQDGERSPVLALDNGRILEGLYIPRTVDERYNLGFVKSDLSNLEIDVQPAKYEMLGASQPSLTLTRNGTQIKITQFENKEQAIEIAKRLKPIK